MIGLLKKLFCKHSYELLHTYRQDVDDSVGYKEEDIHVVYCPKCKKELRLRPHEFGILMAKQKVNEEYERIEQERNTRQP